MKALLWIAPLSLVVLPFLETARALPAQDQHGEHAESELATHMETIEDTVKLLRRNLKEASTRPEALTALAEIQRLSLVCKGLVPAAAAKLPEGERAAFARAYRRTMVDFLAVQLELEAALLDGDEEAIKSSFDRFRAMEDSAHERFAPEDG